MKGFATPQSPSARGQKSPLRLDAARRHRKLDLRFVCVGLLCFCLCSFAVFYSPLSFPNSAMFPYHAPDSVCTTHLANGDTHSGFKETPVDSTVLMLYTPTGNVSGFCYGDGDAGGGTTVEREFLRVAASYVSSPYTKPSSPYHDFFSAHDATLWTVDRVARVAAPMRLDVVYTYVNPRAPSFERHLKMRNVPFEQRRYRDWEELRYSLRSLRAFMLDNDALAQHHRRHTADVRRLGELGYRVDESGVDAGAVVPLVRRVHLVVSDVDQVPAWLDAERFPELRVVTHRDMFTAEEAEWVLPTMNSNVIESGMHRIPNISRFFLYFNNDMIVGRKMSFFDLFRPLSPPRQLLEMVDLISATKLDVGTVYARDDAATRRLVFFESIFNSDGYAAPPRRSLLASAAAALVPKSVCVRLAESVRSSRWHERLVRTLCVPKQLPVPSVNGRNALNHFARYRVQNELPGVVPSMEYAHMPRIVDREISRTMLEDREDGFGELVADMRSAYLRTMNMFSPAHMYESFALAERRSRVGALWCQSDSRCAATLVDLYPRLARRWRRVRSTFCPGHPLEGISQAVRLQHAEMLSRWDAYEGTWLAESVKPGRRHAEQTLEVWRNSTTVAPTCSTCLSSHVVPPLLSNVPYRPSAPIKALLSQAAARTPESTTVELLTGCHSHEAPDPSRVQALVLDVHHHVSTQDKTFRFFIVEDLQRLAIILAKIEQMVSLDHTAAAYAKNVSLAHPGFHSSHLPLFVTVNDDLPGSALDKQARPSELAGWNETLLAETLFRRLLWLSSYMAPSAPWERDKVPRPTEAS